MNRYRILWGLAMFNIERDCKHPDFYLSFFWRTIEFLKIKGHKTDIVLEISINKNIIYKSGY